MSPPAARAFAAVVALGVGVALLTSVPRAWCGRDASAWYRGSAERSRALGSAVASDLSALDATHFSTGSRRFDAEWRFGSALMAALGFGQTALEHPELRAWALEQMDRALDSALAPAGRAFDGEAWGEDALESLPGPRGHAAYLGYLELALSLRRFVAPGSRFDAWDDRIGDALTRRFEASPGLVLETYPGERYPVDNCAGIGGIALGDRAVGREPRELVRRFGERLRERFIDPRTGLVVQAVSEAGAPTDRARGSGSALAAYFLSFADAQLSRDVYRALRRELASDVLGFGVVREYPRGIDAGAGDIDSGPLVNGWSISAMGFSLSSARAQRDQDEFVALYRAFHLFGAPDARRGELRFVSGGALGNAISFAMLTALPAERWSRP